MQSLLPIYMDYSATTPVDPRVAEKMIPYLTSQFGNPASRSHPYGWDAEQAVEAARGEVAKLVNRDPRTIVWVPVILVVLFILRGLGDFTQTYFMGYVGRRVVTRLRGERRFDSAQELIDQMALDVAQAREICG